VSTLSSLWIEDNLNTIWGSLRNLKYSGMDFRVAQTSTAAEQELRSNTFNCIILDSHMLTKDRQTEHVGCELYTELRAGKYGPWGRSVLIIFLTAYSNGVRDRLGSRAQPEACDTASYEQLFLFLQKDPTTVLIFEKSRPDDFENFLLRTAQSLPLGRSTELAQLPADPPADVREWTHQSPGEALDIRIADAPETFSHVWVERSPAPNAKPSDHDEFQLLVSLDHCPERAVELSVEIPAPTPDPSYFCLADIEVLAICPSVKIHPVSMRLPLPPRSEAIARFSLLSPPDGSHCVRVVFLARGEPFHSSLVQFSITDSHDVTVNGWEM
jgi:hypothetical protein